MLLLAMLPFPFAMIPLQCWWQWHNGNNNGNYNDNNNCNWIENDNDVCNVNSNIAMTIATWQQVTNAIYGAIAKISIDISMVTTTIAVEFTMTMTNVISMATLQWHHGNRLLLPALAPLPSFHWHCHVAITMLPCAMLPISINMAMVSW